MQNPRVDISQVVQECREDIRKYGKWLIEQPRVVVEAEYAKYSKPLATPAKALSGINLTNRTISYYGKQLVDFRNQLLRENIEA